MRDRLIYVSERESSCVRVTVIMLSNRRSFLTYEGVGQGLATFLGI